MPTFFITFFALFLGFPTPNAGTVKVVLPEIKSPNKGILHISLYDSKDSFLDAETAVQAKSLQTFQSGVSVEFTGLPYGEYAVGVLHDKNGNGKLDKNFIGIPKEPVGISNMSSFGIPSFSKAKFKLNKKIKTLNIKFLND